MRTFYAFSLCGLFAAAFLALAVSVSAQTVLDKAKNDQIARVPKGDAEMAAAFRKARATLKEFLALARAPRSSITNYAVKVGIPEGDTTEYFWISKFIEKDGEFIGRIDNTPRLVRSVREGQRILFEESDIVDWLYRENGKMVGNYTACALLKKEPPRQAEAFKKEFGLACDP